MPALQALNADVSTEADYPPLIAAAGVFFLETNQITRLYLHNHSAYLKTALRLRAKAGPTIVNPVSQRDGSPARCLSEISPGRGEYNPS